MTTFKHASHNCACGVNIIDPACLRHNGYVSTATWLSKLAVGNQRVSEERISSLTFSEVSTINSERANRWHEGFPDSKDGWTGADWSNAMQGEAGEAGNVVKKLRLIEIGIKKAEQGQEKDESYMAMLKEKLATEIGDTFLYLDLLAQFYGLDITKCIVDTFNRVSDREGFPEKIVG